MFRAGGEFVTITFDATGRINERGLGFGRFAQVAQQLQDQADGDRNGYDMGGAIIVTPFLYPADVSEIVRDALMLRLPPSLTRTLTPHQAAAWSRGA
jgi:hypothetical protein